MRRALSYAGIVVGAGIAVVSVLADEVGIGAAPGFGLRQLLGVLLGVGLLGAAWFWAPRE